MKKLFLDDIRMPKEGAHFVTNLEAIKHYNTDDWDIVRNYDEFVEYINKHGLPTIIGFDHDLADAHYQQSIMTEEELANTPYQKKEKTGADCASWLIQYCVNNKKNLPICYVHSANPVGKKRIEQILGDFKKLQMLM